MRVLKWGVPSTSQRSLQTVKQAGAEECSQPQWGAAAARPGIGGLPRSIQGPANSASDPEPLNWKGSFTCASGGRGWLWIYTVEQAWKRDKNSLDQCTSCDWRTDHLLRLCRKPSRSQSTYLIQHPHLQLLLASWSCWVRLPFVSSQYAGGC